MTKIDSKISSSNSGGLTIVITFDISANPELSAVEVQNRVKLAESRLPAEVVQNGIKAVSYTHLDVYKRQIQGKAGNSDQRNFGYLYF